MLFEGGDDKIELLGVRIGRFCFSFCKIKIIRNLVFFFIIEKGFFVYDLYKRLIDR